jgi:hypothetical protein
MEKANKLHPPQKVVGKRAVNYGTKIGKGDKNRPGLKKDLTADHSALKMDQ